MRHEKKEPFLRHEERDRPTSLWHRFGQTLHLHLGNGAVLFLKPPLLLAKLPLREPLLLAFPALFHCAAVAVSGSRASASLDRPSLPPFIESPDSRAVSLAFPPRTVPRSRELAEVDEAMIIRCHGRKSVGMILLTFACEPRTSLFREAQPA
jgi:hypothetical protein